MKPDDKTERIKPVEDREENPSIERERESEASEVQEPQPTGWAAQLRQIMRGSAQGEARTNITADVKSLIEVLRRIDGYDQSKELVPAVEFTN
jgi:hypothetical protein